MRLIYLDYAATTPVDPRVMRVMRQYFSEKFGNPGSGHRIGQESFRAVSHSRDIVAGAFGCEPKGVIFTSSATEANNLALRGVVRGITNYQLPITKGDESRDLSERAQANGHGSDPPTGGEESEPSRELNFVSSRKSPNKVRIDFRGSRPSAMEVLKLFKPKQFGDNGILEAVSAPTSRTASGLGRRVVAKSTGSPPHVVITAIEHESVFEVCRLLEEEGLAEVTYLGVSRDGIVNPADIAKALRPETVLVSVMYANNEIGTIQPISEIAALIRDFRNSKLETLAFFAKGGEPRALSGRAQASGQGVPPRGTSEPSTERAVSPGRRVVAKSTGSPPLYPLFHTDAVQAVQFLDCDMERLGVDLMTISSHKIYGPKGAAALVMRNPKHEARSSKQVQSSKLKTQNPVSNFEFRISDLRQLVSPTIVGGGQEYGLRSGTENVPAIVGFGKALELALLRRDKESKRLTKLRDYFIARLLALNKGVILNGSVAHRLPNNINVSFPSKNAQMLITAFDRCGIAVSAGSACASHSLKLSRAIRALGLDQRLESSAIRFSLGSKTTRQDLDYVMQTIVKLL